MSTKGPKSNGTSGTNGREMPEPAEMSTKGPKSNGTSGTNGPRVRRNEHNQMGHLGQRSQRSRGPIRNCHVSSQEKKSK
ncbi:hypothetical protein KI387_039744, partial [Taxus chinensis]